MCPVQRGRLVLADYATETRPKTVRIRSELGVHTARLGAVGLCRGDKGIRKSVTKKVEHDLALVEL